MRWRLGLPVALILVAMAGTFCVLHVPLLPGKPTEVMVEVRPPPMPLRNTPATLPPTPSITPTPLAATPTPTPPPGDPA